MMFHRHHAFGSHFASEHRLIRKIEALEESQPGMDPQEELRRLREERDGLRAEVLQLKSNRDAQEARLVRLERIAEMASLPAFPQADANGRVSVPVLEQFPAAESPAAGAFLQQQVDNTYGGPMARTHFQEYPERYQRLRIRSTPPRVEPSLPPAIEMPTKRKVRPEPMHGQMRTSYTRGIGMHREYYDAFNHVWQMGEITQSSEEISRLAAQEEAQRQMRLEAAQARYDAAGRTLREFNNSGRDAALYDDREKVKAGRRIMGWTDGRTERVAPVNLPQYSYVDRTGVYGGGVIEGYSHLTLPGEGYVYLNYKGRKNIRLPVAKDSVYSNTVQNITTAEEWNAFLQRSKELLGLPMTAAVPVAQEVQPQPTSQAYAFSAGPTAERFGRKSLEPVSATAPAQASTAQEVVQEKTGPVELTAQQMEVFAPIAEKYSSIMLADQGKKIIIDLKNDMTPEALQTVKTILGDEGVSAVDLDGKRLSMTIEPATFWESMKILPVFAAINVHLN